MQGIASSVKVFIDETTLPKLRGLFCLVLLIKTLAKFGFLFKIDTLTLLYNFH
jgi:hypothetical protein